MNSTPTSEPSTSRQTILNATGIVLLLGLIGAGVVFARRYVEKDIATPPLPPRVVINNRPLWMSDALADQIALCARPAKTHSAFDQQTLVDAANALKANPWVKDVKEVRRVYGQQPGDIILIDCQFRAPVALVRWDNTFWLVDSEGFKLPEQYTPNQVPRVMMGRDGKPNIRLIDGVAQAPPTAGKKWTGDDLAAGLEMVNLLASQPFASEIVKVNVGNFAGRHDAREAQIVLVTRYLTEIRWGRPVSAADAFVEVRPERKLDSLQRVFAKYNRIDANQPWIDVRFDLPTRPGDPPPLAHSTPRRR